jgi:DNA repair photolyase
VKWFQTQQGKNMSQDTNITKIDSSKSEPAANINLTQEKSAQTDTPAETMDPLSGAGGNLVNGVNQGVLIEKIQGKPVLYRENAKTVLTMKSDFKHKLLCTGPVLNMGDACVYGCTYCYVPSSMRKLVFPILKGRAHDEVVIRRPNALQLLRNQLAVNKEKNAPHVVYSSSLVDIAANIELMRETAEACLMVFEQTNWEMRLLTKSNLLPRLVREIPEKFHKRLILGVSTGTFTDEIGKVIEIGTALVSKRIESLHWLQDNGFRTFAMVCPSLPQNDYAVFAQQAAELLRYDRCEHVWAEVINIRGASFENTMAVLDGAGLLVERNKLALVCGDAEGAQDRWEAYARATFEAHADVVGHEKLRFLQYIDRKENIEYWAAQKERGAVLLGRHGVPKKKKEVNLVSKGAEKKGAEKVKSSKTKAKIARKRNLSRFIRSQLPPE